MNLADADWTSMSLGLGLALTVIGVFGVIAVIRYGRRRWRRDVERGAGIHITEVEAGHYRVHEQRGGVGCFPIFIGVVFGFVALAGVFVLLGSGLAVLLER